MWSRLCFTKPAGSDFAGTTIRTSNGGVVEGEYSGHCRSVSPVPVTSFRTHSGRSYRQCIGISRLIRDGSWAREESHVESVYGCAGWV